MFPLKSGKSVEERAEGFCEYCLSPTNYSTQSFSVEHISPRAKSGTNKLDNLALACQGCNSYKNIKTEAVDPNSKKRVLLYHPRKQKWETHFSWSEDKLRVIGKTAIGRATIEALRLNREKVINLRRLLLAFGLHPPKRTKQITK